MTKSEEQNYRRLEDGCEEMKRLILDFKIPEGVIRRYLSFETAEYVLSDNSLTV